MTASINDKVTKVGLPGSATTLASPGYTMGATSINLTSATNWETTTAVHFDMFTTEISGNEEVEVANTRTSWKGVLSGTTVSSLQLKYGTDQNYAAGTNTKVVITPSTIRENEMADHILTEHAQDGTHDPTKVAMLAGTQTFTGTKTFSTAPVLPNNSIPAAALATSAITLGYVETSSAHNTGATTSTVDIASMSVTVTVPAGGRRIEIEAWASTVLNASGTGTNTRLNIQEGTTVLSFSDIALPTSDQRAIGSVKYSAVVSAGSHTYKLTTANTVATNVQFNASSTNKIYLTVKAV